MSFRYLRRGLARERMGGVAGAVRGGGAPPRPDPPPNAETLALWLDVEAFWDRADDDQITEWPNWAGGPQPVIGAVGAVLKETGGPGNGRRVHFPRQAMPLRWTGPSSVVGLAAAVCHTDTWLGKVLTSTTASHGVVGFECSSASPSMISWLPWLATINFAPTPPPGVWWSAAWRRGTPETMRANGWGKIGNALEQTPAFSTLILGSHTPGEPISTVCVLAWNANPPDPVAVTSWMNERWGTSV